MAENLDDIDWQLVAALQSDGRATIAELARRITLSPTATAERVRRLESRGVVTGYAAQVDLRKVGVEVLSIVRLQYTGRAREPLAHLIERRQEILECQRVTGDDCYVIKVAATSMEHLASVVDDLGDLGPVTTSVVFNEPLKYRGLRRPLNPRGSD